MTKYGGVSHAVLDSLKFGKVGKTGAEIGREIGMDNGVYVILNRLQEKKWVQSERIPGNLVLYTLTQRGRWALKGYNYLEKANCG